jgi:hypothetical protein
MTDEVAEDFTFIHLFDANIAAVDRAAHCFVDRRSASCWELAFDNLFDYWFWETLYGPLHDGPDAEGLVDWDDAYDDA